jgi:hypothetical protein
MVQDKPAYENYPVSEEEMCKRYKSWMQVLARYVVMAYNTGKEVGGEKYVERLKEKFHTMGQKSAGMWMELSNSSAEEMKDCMGIPKLQDCMDDTFANFWNGYIETTPNAFEKEVYTCPIVGIWSKQPEICEILLGASMSGMMENLNPKFKPKGFSRLLVKGDKTCRFRVEMED